MNERFTDEQIKAYATHFMVGDAIWCNGEWHEVVENEVNGDSRLTAHVDKNIFVINDVLSGNHYGFKVTGRNENPYRVTTIEHYELQGGEKIVWLGESDHMRKFGKIYTVDWGMRYTDDLGGVITVGSLGWGIIPRYEQVKDKPKRSVSDEEFDKLLNEIDKTLEPIKNANQLSHVVQYPTAADREEEVLKLKIFELFVEDMSDDDVIDDLKDIAIVQIRKNNYNKAIEAINAIKEWEEKK